jgi:protocatechuate 3,4-dioxygenase beta subunit
MPRSSLPAALAVAAAVTAAVVSLACSAQASPREVLVGGPCQGCEAVFEGRPDKLASRARIAPAGEPGEPLVIEGVVTDAAKRPVAGVIVYAYQTDAKGEYPSTEAHRRTAKHRHGMLRGFAQTDAQGRYAFETIRPASYPVPDAPPQHVHLHVIEPGRCHYTIDDLMFTDDPRLTPDLRARMDRGRGGSGVATPVKARSGTWTARRDIVLGEKIADHDRCRSR